MCTLRVGQGAGGRGQGASGAFGDQHQLSHQYRYRTNLSITLMASRMGKGLHAGFFCLKTWVFC